VENGYTTESNLQIHLISIKIQMFLSHKNRKVNPKIHMETQKTLNSQSNPEKKNNDRVIIIMDLKLYYIDKFTKTAWHWHRTDTETNGIECKIQK
jgi:hypothetical protein